MKKIVFGLLLLCTALSFSQDVPDKDSNWEFDVTPYVWFAGVKADIGFRDNDLGQVNADFSDILKNIKMGAMFHVEARKGKWFLLGDLMYVKIRKDGNLELLATPTSLEAKELIMEFAGGYNLVNNNDIFLVDGFVGFRNLNVATRMTIGPAEVLDRTSSTNDPFLGGRFKIKSEKWLFSMRGDIGGFGIGSELSWKVNVLSVHQFSELFSLYFGIQTLGINIEKNDFNLDIITTGLGVGGNFHF